VDKEFAKQVVATALGCGSSLDKLIPELTARCAPDEKEKYVKAIATVMVAMHNAILRPLFDDHPELEQEIDQNVRTRGTFF
jgi:hypothetical protein